MTGKDIVIIALVASNVVFITSGLIVSTELDKQKEKYKKLWDMSVYIAAKAETDGLVFSEFDLIAMRELGFGVGSQIKE